MSEDKMVNKEEGIRRCLIDCSADAFFIYGNMIVNYSPKISDHLIKVRKVLG